MKAEPQTQVIVVRAVRVINYKNGTVGIEVPAEPLSEQDQNTLRRLFPNLTDRVYQVLSQECLLSSLHEGPVIGTKGLSPDIIDCTPNIKKDY